MIKEDGIKVVMDAQNSHSPDSRNSSDLMSEEFNKALSFIFSVNFSFNTMKFVEQPLHSLIQHLLNTYCVPGAFIRGKDTSAKKTDKNACLVELLSGEGRWGDK